MMEKTTPSNGSTGFLPAGQFTLYFTENVTVGAGNIYLYEADGTPVDTFDVTEIYFDQNLFSFTPVSPLEPGAGYYIEIDAGIVSDWKNLDFEAVTGSDIWSFTVASTDLYFSEYVEGSSNNKALEIYNPTNATVDLSQYGIATSTNGGDWHDPDPLTGMLEPGDVYVIINSGFDFSLIDSAAIVDTIWGFATNHNGNDGRALVKLIEGSWDGDHTSSFIDVIGYNDGDIGDGWDVAGVTAATKNHTLIRKATISIGNTDFTESAGTNAEDSEWRVFDQDFFTNLGYATPDASDETDILEFTLLDTLGNNITVTSSIDSVAFTADVEILSGYGSVVDSLVPEITLSEGATGDPASGDTVDFTLPATFTVTAEDELTTQDWTVTVTVAITKSTETDILAFEVDNQTGDAVIDTATHTVTIEVEYLTDLTAITPGIEISSYATIVPLSGVIQDFTDPVIYTVTAEDGTTMQEWTITISEEIIPCMSIYDIQYTTETSGDSPHINEQVRVSGIVTAIDFPQDFKGYFLQDSSRTWNGIYVYDPDRNSTEPGDSLTVVGTIAEYYNVTQVSCVVEYIENSTGNILPDPLIITTGVTDPEQFECVLVTVENAECTNNDLGDDEIELNDGSGAIIIDDYLYDYTSTEAFTNNNLYRVTGVMYYTYGDYKIIPRDANDIEDVTTVNDPFAGVNIQVYPNPSNGLFKLVVNNIKSGSLGIEIMNLQGQIIFKNVINDPTGFSEYIDLTKFGKGLYFLRINDGNKATVEKILIQ
jgi:methionine-rich copper-binding protein CopC